MKIHLERERLRANLTIKKQSDLSGVSTGMISMIESGERMPTLDTLCKLAKALRIPTVELYDCDGWV